MNPKNPPRIATWMMEHLTPSGSDDAIAGDLLEHFRAGRSTGWYWRQVITAIAAELSRRVWLHRVPLLFAAMWSFLAPAWVLLNARLHWDRSVAMLRIPWPWSMVLPIFLGSACCLSGLGFLFTSRFVEPHSGDCTSVDLGSQFFRVSSPSRLRKFARS